MAISEQKYTWADQTNICAVMVTGLNFYACICAKICADKEDDDDECHGTVGGKKGYILYDTFKKWQRDIDKEFKALRWLDCVTTFQSGKKVVVTLRCSICCWFKERLKSSRNFSDKWISGADSLRTSNIHYHASDNTASQGKCYCQRWWSVFIRSYWKAMQNMSDTEKTRLRHKLDIAYLVATEKIAFLKYLVLWRKAWH